jgi:REP element-mobilizing transposase RayT
MNLFAANIKTDFGGSLLNGKRKSARPLDSTKPIHTILKATNSLLLLKNRAKIEDILNTYAKRFALKIYDCGIHADHIHLSLKIPNRRLYLRWIRAVTSVLVLRFKGLKWKLRPYTRVAAWGRAFGVLQKYIWKNREEGSLILNAFEYLESFRSRVLIGIESSLFRRVPPETWSDSLRNFCRTGAGLAQPTGPARQPPAQLTSTQHFSLTVRRSNPAAQTSWPRQPRKFHDHNPASAKRRARSCSLTPRAHPNRCGGLGDG